MALKANILISGTRLEILLVDTTLHNNSNYTLVFGSLQSDCSLVCCTCQFLHQALIEATRAALFIIYFINQTLSWSQFLLHNVTVSQTSLGRRGFHRYSENQTNQSLMRYICNREDKSWTRTMFSIFLPSFYLHYSGLTLSATLKAKIIKQFDNCREIWHLAPTIFRLVKILSVQSVRSYCILYSPIVKL